ncbi:hypothetical protein ONS95_011832 [Cadophora gregata]|uniref:uncharacterized protein n=1 Tax=Cadophora gregata TaxID=51156 RepID=UPI0026DC746A|nr:uncharacterized protein ONS95_011832 [Cadophora gregata]KAK0117492.1 hypothetical protein ONS95_011832 [Cadophora gregata]KAK0122547.1 hypothetical protein ONS96_009589 [Cadophora gregata f. sp. sojae]
MKPRSNSHMKQDPQVESFTNTDTYSRSNTPLAARPPIHRRIESQNDSESLPDGPSSGGVNFHERNHANRYPRHPISNAGHRDSNGSPQQKPVSGTIENNERLYRPRHSNRLENEYEKMRTEMQNGEGHQFSTQSINISQIILESRDLPNFYTSSWLYTPAYERIQSQITRPGFDSARQLEGEPLWKMEKPDREGALERIREIESGPPKDIDLKGVPRKKWKNIFHFEEREYQGIDLSKMRKVYRPALLHLYKNWRPYTESRKAPSHDLKGYIRSNRGVDSEQPLEIKRGRVPRNLEAKLRRSLGRNLSLLAADETQSPHGEEQTDMETGVADTERVDRGTAETELAETDNAETENAGAEFAEAEVAETAETDNAQVDTELSESNNYILVANPETGILRKDGSGRPRGEQ